MGAPDDEDTAWVTESSVEVSTPGDTVDSV